MMVGSSCISSSPEGSPITMGDIEVRSSNKTVKNGVLYVDSLDSICIPKGCHQSMTYNTNRVRTVGPVGESVMANPNVPSQLYNGER